MRQKWFLFFISTLRPTKSLSSVPCYPHPDWDPQSLCHLFHVIHIHTETHKVSVICSMLFTSTLRPTKSLSSVPCYPHPHWDPQSFCHLFHVIHIHTETHKVSVICSMLSTSTLRPTKSLSSVPCLASDLTRLLQTLKFYFVPDAAQNLMDT